MAKKTQIKGPGRPSKLTDDVIAKIVAGLRDGLPRKYAAIAGGLSESGFHRAYAQGEDDEAAGTDSVFAKFKFAVDGAEMELLRGDLKRVRAGGRDWKALAWFIERRFREQFLASEAARQENMASSKVVIEVPSYGSDSTDVSAASETDTTSPKR